MVLRGCLSTRRVAEAAVRMWQTAEEGEMFEPRILYASSVKCDKTNIGVCPAPHQVLGHLA